MGAAPSNCCWCIVRMIAQLRGHLCLLEGDFEMVALPEGANRKSFGPRNFWNWL